MRDITAPQRKDDPRPALPVARAGGAGIGASAHAQRVWRFYLAGRAPAYASRYRNGAMLLSRYGYEVKADMTGARAAAGDYMAFQMQLPSGAMESWHADAETQAIAGATTEKYGRLTR